MSTYVFRVRLVNEDIGSWVGRKPDSITGIPLPISIIYIPDLDEKELMYLSQFLHQLGYELQEIIPDGKLADIIPADKIVP